MEGRDGGRGVGDISAALKVKERENGMQKVKTTVTKNVSNFFLFESYFIVNEVILHGE